MWKICDVQPFLLLAAVRDLRLLFRKLFIARPSLLSLLDAGMALQGLSTQVLSKHRFSFRRVARVDKCQSHVGDVEARDLNMPASIFVWTSGWTGQVVG